MSLIPAQSSADGRYDLSPCPRNLQGKKTAESHQTYPVALCAASEPRFFLLRQVLVRDDLGRDSALCGLDALRVGPDDAGDLVEGVVAGLAEDVQDGLVAAAEGTDLRGWDDLDRGRSVPRGDHVIVLFCRAVRTLCSINCGL